MSVINSPATRRVRPGVLLVVMALVAAAGLGRADPAAAAVTVGAGTYENTSSMITYTGSWASSSSSLDSGGSVGTLAVTGDAQLTFKETSVKIIARTGNYYGIANVYLDGTQVATIDQYSATTTFKKVAWTSPTLSYATHTLRVERAGTKNDASTGRTINLDSFVVADTRAPATPTGLTATAEGNGARITFAASTETDLAGYLVYRATGTSTTYTPLTDTPITTTSYLDPALTPDTTYRYGVSAVDTSGNESARTDDVALAAQVKVVPAGTYEETADAFSLTGTWTPSSSSQDSGGSVGTLATTGYAQISFKETSVKIIARTGSYYGIANVYLDGTQVATIDQYSATTTFKKVAWTSPTLSYATHTLRVERAGTKNDASSGRTINLDALVVADTRAPATPTGLTAAVEGNGARVSWSPSLDPDVAGYLVYRATGTSTAYTALTDTPVSATSYLDPALNPDTTYRYRVSAVDTSGNESARTDDATVSPKVVVVPAGTYEETADALTLTGTWTPSSSSQDSGGSVGTLATTGYAQISFKETSVKIIARTGSYYGIANIYLDGTQVATIDQYSAVTTFRTVAYTSPTLSDGTHTLRIERAGTKNDASTGRTINLDALVVVDSHAPATPTGLSAAAEGPGARLTWTASPEADLAGYLVYRAVGTSTTYTPLTDTPVTDTSYLDPTLTPDTTYHYRIAAVDTSGNVSGQTADANLASQVKVVGAGTVENDDPAVASVGTWTTASYQSDSGGSISTLATTGYAQLSFKETSVKLIARTGSYYGIANVYLDGTQVATVDQYSAATSYKNVVWTSPTLTDGTHTLRIERAGTKNDASTGRTINIDSFVVADSHAPAVPTGLTAKPEGTGARLSWSASPEADLAGYLVYRATGTSTTYSPLTDTPVTDTGYLDPTLTPDATYRYKITAVDTSQNESAATADVGLHSAVGAGAYRSDSTSVTLRGGWTSDVDQSQITTGAGTASLTFLESGVRWIGSTGPTGGTAAVSIDGSLVANVDQYSPTTIRGVKLYEATGLGAGVHTVTVAWTSGHNTAVTTSSPTTSVASFVVPDTTAPAAPRSVYALPAGNGIDLEWDDSPEQVAGYRVYRAKGTDTTYTSLSSAPQSGSSFLDANLVPGVTYHYRVSAVDTSGNESDRSDDVFATTALSTGTVDNTSAAITYSTPWSVSSSTKDSGGSYATLAAPGDAKLTFSGTGVKWVTRTNNFSGIGQVYVDGVAVAKVDLYSAVQQYQQVVWSTSSLPDGTHTIRIERTGTLNPASAGRNLTLDAFVVTDSTPPPTMPAVTFAYARLGVTIGWSASTAADVAAYNLYRTEPDGTETLLDRLPPTQTSFFDVGLAPATTYGYRVTAIDTSGNESKSVAPTSMTTPAPATHMHRRAQDCPTATRPVSTAGGLQYALGTAAPGDVIVLAPGTYTGYFTTSVTGTATNPVWICGPRDAVIDFKDPTTGTGISLVGASWVTVTGMTIQNVQKGVVVSGGAHDVVSDVVIHDIGEEGIHLRSSAVDNVVIGNLIQRTGTYMAQYGEGVYVGSDPDAWCTYSSCQPDRSDRNVVIFNTMNALTAEGVDAKAGTTGGTVKGNVIDGAQMTPANSGGWVVIKGSSWLVSGNTGTNAPANGFTATYSKADGWGGDNVFVNNHTTLNNDTGFGIWLQRGIGNIAGCDNTAPGGVRVSNLVCQR